MSQIAIEPGPFLKWAGGKRQILPSLEARFPSPMLKGMVTRYIEPFLGGGAVFFRIFRPYSLKDAFLSDLNPDLCLVWTVVKDNPGELIEVLRPLAGEYKRRDPTGRQELYYKVREDFNRECGCNRPGGREGIERAAHLLFLNRTCFNGLYRVNSRGEFNVPFGRYSRPSILDERNIVAASALLADCEIRCGDFSLCTAIATPGSFVYLDPPYRPLSRTASFTSYASGGFPDEEQVRLAKIFRQLDDLGAYVMLSNSDPKNSDPEDDFFDRLYEGFRVERISARRFINSDGNGRGAIQEIIVTNYQNVM